MLNETVIRRLNRIIKEDLSINDEFDCYIDQIGREILKQYNAETSKKRSGFDYSDSGSLPGEYDGHKYTIYWSVYEFSDYSKYEKFVSEGGFVESYFMYGFKWVKIPVIVIGGHLDVGEFYDSLHHEMEHFFQTGNMGRDFGNQLSYAFARDNLNCKDELVRHLSTLLYANEKTGEQDAMINGLWGSLKNNGSYPLIEDALERSEAYVYLKRLYAALKFFNSNSGNEELIRKYYELRGKIGINYSFRSLRRFTKKAIKSFERKMGRVIYKFKKKYLVNNGVRFSKLNLNEGIYPGFLIINHSNELINEAKKYRENAVKNYLYESSCLNVKKLKYVQLQTIS